MSDRFGPGADADSVAISVDGRSVSYAELDSLVDNFEPPAGGVLDLSGLDVVTTLVAVFAAARSGFTVLLRDPDSQLPALPVLPPDSFLVAMTSGTSGRQRVVVRSVRSWLSSFRPFADFTGLGRHDVVLLTGPLHSTLHLFAAIHTLWLGAQLTDDAAAATAVHAVPTVLADLFVDAPRGLRTAVVAGSALPPAVEQRALELGVRLIEYYGAAELSFVGIRVCPDAMIPFPAVRIRIVDGVLWVRSPYLALGRFSMTNDRLSAGELMTDDGFASAGDLAEMTEDGTLVVRGRGDRAVTTGGHTVIVEDVETVISALSGVLAVAVVGMPHDRLGQILTAVVELRPGTELAAVRRAARGHLNGPALPRRWHVVAIMPRTASGKVARGLIAAELIAEGPLGRSASGRGRRGSGSPGSASPGPASPGSTSPVRAG